MAETAYFSRRLTDRGRGMHYPPPTTTSPVAMFAETRILCGQLPHTPVLLPASEPVSQSVLSSICQVNLQTWFGSRLVEMTFIWNIIAEPNATLASGFKHHSVVRPFLLHWHSATCICVQRMNAKAARDHVNTMYSASALRYNAFPSMMMIRHWHQQLGH